MLRTIVTQITIRKQDEELADGLIELAECGATLVDVMGDMFYKHNEELTDDIIAVEKQLRLTRQDVTLGPLVTICPLVFELRICQFLVWMETF